MLRSGEYHIPYEMLCIGVAWHRMRDFEARKAPETQKGACGSLCVAEEGIKQMSQRTFATIHQRVQWRRRGAAALLLGLALVVAACGAGPQTGPSPTATPKPTATATPVPCSTWRIVPSPNQTQYSESTLNAVSAVSPTAAWAIGGSITDGIAEQSLIEQWDGSAWHIVANSNRISFSSMVAVSPADIWAVGYNRTPRAEFSFVSQFEHWNGTQWSTVPSPNSNRPNNFLLSMAAVSANDVWAVGKDLSTNTGLPLTERWNGTSWQVVATPAFPNVSDSELDSVARIPGTGQLWAVGYTLGPRPAYEQALIERWDGTAWQVVTSPALPGGAFGSKLHGVIALSATDAWAVGEYVASNHTIRTLVAHWNGSAWQVAASPDTWGSLASVAAVGPGDVRAVGHIAIDDGNNQHALIEQWDGSAWHMLRGPEPGTVGYSNLGGVATDGAGGYWAVGSYGNANSPAKTLILRCQ